MKVFIVDMSKLKVDELRVNLSSYEASFAENIQNSHAQERYIVSKAIVRKLLADTKPLKGVAPSDIEIKVGSNGKPYVEGRPIYYNVSHSEDLLVVAIDNAEVGVDMEHMKERNFKALTEYYFDGKESVIERILQSADIKTEFYKQWTLTEAEIKLAGVGLFNWKQQNVRLIAKFHYSRVVNDEYMLTIASNHAEITPDIVGYNEAKDNFSICVAKAK